MDAQFWIDAWNDGRTNFNQQNFHPKMVEFFPQLGPQKGQKLLVPLCGKSRDMIWLKDLGVEVHGIELYERPVQEFFVENKLGTPEKNQDQDFVNYSVDNITISAGDFFKVPGQEVYDLIYDRASLVALPPEMRKDYAQVIKRVLKKGGKYLLISYAYDQSLMEGPPFSVTTEEIHQLYQDSFTIRPIESLRPSNEGARLAANQTIKQEIYILEKL